MPEIGQTISHYKIIEKLGAGGMGIVYKAHDSQLDRLVALKTLPPDRAADPERQRRFAQEARAVSALNHPNIVTVYAIDQVDGMHLISMEYVEGEVLARLIGRKGLPLKQALQYGIQIADALAGAHAKGIVHRDLKPTNVMVTSAGAVKVLDFGLAKLTEKPADADGPTRTLQTTQEGQIVGTAAYMSPEQAEGGRVDARSDIFSLGALLYAMITGRQAFQGSSGMSILAAIMTLDPEPLAGAAPPDLEKIIMRCLRKRPAQRFQHIDDVKVELEELLVAVESGKPAEPVPPRSRRHVLPFALAGLAVLLAAAVLAYFLGKRGTSEPELAFTQLTDQPGAEVSPSFSPDGGSFVYAGRASGNWDIYLQRVGGRNPINLTKDSPSDDTTPAFSPDGQRILFRSERSGGGIFVMGATGESVRRLTDFGFGPAWSPDGQEFICSTGDSPRPEYSFTQGTALVVVNLASGLKRTMPDLYEPAHPQWSPHGSRIAFWGRLHGNRDIFTVPAQGGQASPVTQDAFIDWNPVWSPDGQYLYFSSDRGGSMNIWRVRIDEASGKVLGEPRPLTTPSLYSSQITLSKDGSLAYSQQVLTTNLQKVALDSAREVALGTPVPLTQGFQQVRAPDISPDGNWLVFSSWGKREDILLMRYDGTDLRQLTDDPARDRHPRWSPDGKRVLFYSNRSGNYEAWTIMPDGSGLTQMTRHSKEVLYPIWSPDGIRIVCTVFGENPILFDAAKPPEQTPATLVPANSPNAHLRVTSWSPDGQKLAGFLSSGDGRFAGVAVYTLESHELRQVTKFGSFPAWLSDSRRLLVNDQTGMVWVDSETGRTREILSMSPNEFSLGFALSRDNRTVYFSVDVADSDIWLMKTR